MPVFDATPYTGELLWWKTEVAARVHDIVSRRAGPLSGKLRHAVEVIQHRLQSAVSAAGLRSALTELIQHFRREPEVHHDEEREDFLRRISQHRQHETIENYSEYLFTVSIDL